MPAQFLDRAIRLPATPSQVAATRGPHDEWQMTDAERGTFNSVLRSLRPLCAIEVGVYRAGSLGIVASHATKVYALDIDPSCAERYAAKFPNVEFIIGSSVTTLPALLRQLQARGEPVDFVLIDGDHSEAGVAADIRSVLDYRPKRPLYILMHDSFNPECRRAMQSAAWASNPFVHSVELDFVTGRLVGPDDPDFYRQMWNGLCLAVMLPEPRAGDLRIHANDATMFDASYRESVYHRERSLNPMHAMSTARKGLRHRLSEVGRTRAPHVYATLRAMRDRFSKSY